MDFLERANNVRDVISEGSVDTTVTDILLRLVRVVNIEIADVGNIGNMIGRTTLIARYQDGVALANTDVEMVDGSPYLHRHEGYAIHRDGERVAYIIPTMHVHEEKK